MSPAQDLPGIDLVRLEPFLREHLGARDGDAYGATLLSGGKSNVTYFLEWGERSLVLRRPPLGDHNPKAHDVSREFRLLTALWPTAVPVPKPIAHHDADDLIGAQFYVMDKVEGRVLREAADAPDLADETRMGRLGTALVEGMVALHSVDPADVGLAELGRADGYIERQVNRWADQWTRSQERSVPALDEIGRRLRAAIAAGTFDPNPERPYIVHGDYNVGNVIVASAEDFDRSDVLRAVLDWEMATLGHPLMDLGVLVSYNGPYADLVGETEHHVTTLPGFPSTDELAAAYGQQTGRDMSSFAFFHVLAFYKVLILTEDVRSRFLAGSTVGEGYDLVGRSVPALADRVLEIADRSGVAGLSG